MLKVINRLIIISLFYLLITINYPFFIFAQEPSSNNFYFCTDEFINLIYFVNDQNKRSLYLTSFSNDNKIHIADSLINDNRSEGDNPIFIQSERNARFNLNTALSRHSSLNNFSKLLISYDYNTQTPFGFLKIKDKVKITLRRLADNSLLFSKTLLINDRSQYLYISPKQILGLRYGCGRGVKLIIERINSAPVIKNINFDYDISQRSFFVNIEVDEPLSWLSFKIFSQRNRQLITEYSTTTNGEQTSFSFPFNLSILAPNQRYLLDLNVKDLENAQSSKKINFTTPNFRLSNPILTEIILKEIGKTQAIIWVLTSKVSDLIREVNSRSIINYGTSTELNLTQNVSINKICSYRNIKYDCAEHRLTQLNPNTLYRFYVTLINDAELITTSTIKEFTTLSSTPPIVTNLKANFTSLDNNIYSITISGKIIDDSLPLNIRATLNNNEIPINFSSRNMFFSVNLNNLSITTTSEIVITITNNHSLSRILRFTLPFLR